MPQATRAMFLAIARGRAASNALARAASVELFLTDVGVDACSLADELTQRGGAAADVRVRHASVARGSACFTTGPAMTTAQLAAAMCAGADAVQDALHSGGSQAAAPGTCVLCLGELGLGNTTAAAALLAALTGLNAREAVGRGTGVDDAGLEAKAGAVAAALSSNAALLSSGDPLAALRAVGGLELAAIAGAVAAAAAKRAPIVIDGFVACAAALVAVRINPSVRRCLFLSHRSAERAAPALLHALDAGVPPLDMGLRLGEGTGALLVLPLLHGAAAVMTDVALLQDVLKEAAGGDEDSQQQQRQQH